MEAASKLTCGLCGYIRPRFGGATDTAWTSFCRAVYCTGPGDDDGNDGRDDGTEGLSSTPAPRLSGVGFHRHDDAAQLATPVPREAHMRFDDPGLSPLSAVVHIRGIRPPAEDLPAAERAEYSWGFVFHDACWQLLEQATVGSVPASATSSGSNRSSSTSVDIRALWRILQSVPCAHDLPNWGHNYGGLYLGVAKDQARGEHFVLLSATSSLIIPSTYSDPLRVPELRDILARLRISEAPPGSNCRNGSSRSRNEAQHVLDNSNTSSTTAPAFSAVSARTSTFATLTDEHVSSATAAAAAATQLGQGKTTRTTTSNSHKGNGDDGDPFAALPFEIREMILTTLASPDVRSLRLASRAISLATPLTQHFFSSRFWPGRELEAIFDGFLLPAGKRSGLDWRGLYVFMRRRLRLNQACLGEKNRLRIWQQTVAPLARAVESVGRHRLDGVVRGKVMWSGPGFWQVWQSSGGDDGSGVGSGDGEEEEGEGGRRIGSVAAEAAPPSGSDAWRTVTTDKQLNPESWGDMGRRVTRAEVGLPDSGDGRLVESVVVSMVNFFDVRYITGLSFVLGPRRRKEMGEGTVNATSGNCGDANDADDTDDDNDVVKVLDLGYIATRSADRVILPVQQQEHQQHKHQQQRLLQGFHVAVDECGFRGLALITTAAASAGAAAAGVGLGPVIMDSEYLCWAGESGGWGRIP
ncbi:hypothetical protein MN608_07229 [Microdochium nivale]|nr:hypothetical protein MN608_07229 [Microdochium nivale]